MFAGNMRVHTHTVILIKPNVYKSRNISAVRVNEMLSEK